MDGRTPIAAWLPPSPPPLPYPPSSLPLPVRLPRQMHGIRPLAWGAAFAEVLLRLPVPLLPPNFRPAEGVEVHGTWSEEVVDLFTCLAFLSALSAFVSTYTTNIASF